jgi:hypothetical protein
MLDFKEVEKESVIQDWKRFKKYTCNLEHGLRDYMLLNSFYYALTQHSKHLLDKESDIRFLFNKPYDVFIILDGMLVEDNIYNSIKHAGIRNMYVKEDNEIEIDEEENIDLNTMDEK